jgi:hypothetical protein
LKPKYDEPLSNFAFKTNLRRYNLARIDRLLAKSGSAKEDLVRAWVHIHDAADVDRARP